ncbi:site-specific integrase [Streptomyces youssoufiensis]
MASARRGGGVTKRCECRGLDGKLLGTACPRLSKKGHGAYVVRQELPPAADGARRTFRRTGYEKVTTAQADLDRIRAILELAGDDADAKRRVGDLLQGVMRDRTEIPDPVEVTRRIGVGVPLDGAMTAGAWLDTWVAAKKTKKRTTTGYESHIRRHLAPRLSHHRLDRLSVTHCQAVFDAIDDENEVIAAENQRRREQEARCKWHKNGRPPAAEQARLQAERAKLAAMPPYRRITGPATQQRIRATLRAALNGAIKRQLITFNPAAHVELAAGTRPKAVLWTSQHVARWRETGEKPSAVMVWTPAQIGAFLDEAESSRLYPIYHLIAFRGLRRGEAVGQNEADIDLDAQTLTVAKEIVLDGWTPVEDTPKTDGSAGTIALDSLTVAVLRENRLRKARERAAWNRHVAQERAQGRAASPWVETGKEFTDVDGAWLHPDKVSVEFTRIAVTAGLPPINLRDLRHCAATLIHAGGGDLHAIKETLRHSTIRLASDTYTSLLQEVDLEIAEKAAMLVPRARRAAGPAQETASPV